MLNSKVSHTRRPIEAVSSPLFVSVISLFAVLLATAPLSGLPTKGPLSIDGPFDATQILTADLDEDSTLDTLAAGPSGVAYWTLSGKTVLGTDPASTPSVGDLDGDGDLDVVAATSTGLICWRNDGGGQFVSVSVGSAVALAASVGDFDLDGDLDVAAATATGLEWYSNDLGDGSQWTQVPLETISDLSALVTGDFDGDGATDIAIGTDTAPSVLSFWRGVDFVRVDVATPASAITALAASDLDRDGRLDLLVAQGDGAIRQISRDGVGGFTEATVAVTSQPSSIAAQDLDQDGDLDLIGAAAGAAVLWENQNGTFVEMVLRTGASIGATAGDIDHDGDMDLLFGGFDGVHWFRHERTHGNAVFPTGLALATLDGARDVLTVDLDGDGDLDAVASGSEAGALLWWENSVGDASLFVEHSIDATVTGIEGIAAGDFDRDGDLDLAGLSSGLDEVWVWRNDGGSFSRETVATGFVDGREVAFGDLDGDGDLDLAGVAFGSQKVTWWRQDAASWFEQTIATGFDRAQAIQLADLDGDGSLDVLAAASVGDELAWWANAAGDGSVFTPRQIATGFDGAFSIEAADLDGDGDLDVLAAAEIGDDVSWFDNVVGDGVTWMRRDVDFLNQARDVRAADLDADGALDLIATGYKDGGRLTWWRNLDGRAGQWQQQVVSSTVDGARSVSIGDLDGDGRLDLLLASQVADEVSIWLGGGGQVAMPSVSTAPATLDPATETELFRFDLLPRGWSEESDLELASVLLAFDEAPGDPLTAAQADAAFVRLRVLRDVPTSLEAGRADAGDLEIASVDSFSALDAEGLLRIDIADDLAEAQVAQNSTATFFVTLETVADLDAQPISGLQVTHLVVDGSTVETVEHQAVLRIEETADAVTPLLPLNQVSDLRLTSSLSADPVLAGESLTYTLTVENLGPSVATGAELELVLGADLSPAATTGCLDDPLVLPTCTLGDLAVGASVQVTLEVDVADDAFGAASLAAAASAATIEGSVGDEAATLGAAILSRAAFSVAVEAPETYVAGESIAWTLRVANAGPGLGAATLTDLFPAGVSDISWSCASGASTCDPMSGLGDVSTEILVPAGDELVLVASGTVDPGTTGFLDNTVSLVPDAERTVDDDPSDDTATASSFGLDPIFRDGFESGDAGAWTLTVGLD